MGYAHVKLTSLGEIVQVSGFSIVIACCCIITFATELCSTLFPNCLKCSGEDVSGDNVCSECMDSFNLEDNRCKRRLNFTY